MDTSARLDLLKNQDWETIILNLTAYAVYKVQRLSWQTGKDSLPGGRQAEDLAFDAIEKVYKGERSWDPTKQPVLLTYLKSVVDSLVSHLVESTEHKQRQQIGDEAENGVFDPPDQQSPMALDELFAADLMGRLWDKVKGDEDVELVLCCIEDEMSKPQDISAALQIPIERIYKAKKKLGIALRAIQKEENDG